MSTQFTNQSTRNAFFVSTFLMIVGTFLMAPHASFAAEESRKVFSGIIVDVTGSTVLVAHGDQKISVSTAGAKINSGLAKNEKSRKQTGSTNLKSAQRQARIRIKKETVALHTGQHVQIIGDEQESGTVKADRITVYSVNK